MNSEDLSRRRQRADDEFRDQGFRIDFSHLKRLSPVDQQRARREATDFLESLNGTFAEKYLHLDVQVHKEQLRGVSQLHWRALLMTDRGRYYASDTGFGVSESLGNTFEALETEMRSRLERLEEQSRGTTVGI